MFKKAVPSAITSLNLLSGFIALIIDDAFYSSLLILLAGLFDLMDGAIARKLNASSKFGAELDSLADVISFGVAPAYLYLHHVLNAKIEIIPIVSVSFIVICAALRLAKFNISDDQKNVFKGLPSPASGLFFTFLVYESYRNSLLNFSNNSLMWLALPVIVGLLMISNIRFYALKGSDIPYNNVIKWLVIAIFLISFVVWAITGYPLMPLAFLIYMVMSIIYYYIILDKKG